MSHPKPPKITSHTAQKRLKKSIALRRHPAAKIVAFADLLDRSTSPFRSVLFRNLFILASKKLKGTWRAIVVFGDKSSEPKWEGHFKAFFDANLVQVVYLKPILKEAPRTFWMNILRLIVATPKEAKPFAREIGPQLTPPKELEDEYIVQLVIGVLLNKFENLTHDGGLMLLSDRFSEVSQAIQDRILASDQETLLSYYKKYGTYKNQKTCLKLNGSLKKACRLATLN